MTRRKRTLFPLFVLVFSLFFTSCGQISGDSSYSDFGRNSGTQELRKEAEEAESIVAELSEYSGEPYTSEGAGKEDGSGKDSPTEQAYVLNTNTKKFHKPDCASVGDIRTSNQSEYSGIREDIIRMGYEPCGRCKP